ncbi:MAG: dTDP-4-dehydrorhamnose 3,5-epimerase [Chloroflexi bacterium]|jgi:dTDP-4-dehydrorhamnose 3,5-epimerase|nr:dTDP-4-dehydrorhamnose 3,5-epimerase [Chloroflexota bacterium]
MEYIRTDIPDIVLIKPRVFGDHRGFFMETFRQSEFDEICGHHEFVQDNHSGSPQGILRGLHYQVKNTQGKLVRVVAGEVFDVAVDIRQGSPTFGKWVGQVLSAENKHQLWVPGGFAHGYLVISEWAEFVYKTTDYYAPEWERSLLWNDPAIGIEWPMVKGQQPTLSEKDANAPVLAEAETFPAS